MLPRYGADGSLFAREFHPPSREVPMASRSGLRLMLGGVLLALILVPVALAATELLKNGDFESLKNGDALRRDDEGQDWYESRKDKEGRKQLILSSKKVSGNRTKKAMLKAHPELNTYLSQRLAKAQTGQLQITYDICIKQIRPEYDRSGFFFAGVSNDKKNGPNSTGKERFVFLGFANTDREGKIDLFAREADSSWDEWTVLATGLDLMVWYTVTVNLDIAAGTSTVQIGDGPVSQPLAAFKTKKLPAPEKITHISFATWNDGAGTFFVDNVSVVAP
jgi:hypothetical protein